MREGKIMIDSFNTFLPQAQVIEPKLAAGATKTETRKAAEDFEAMFITEMLKPMFEGSYDTDPMFGGSHGEEMFQSLMLDEYGKNISASGGIGIADSIEAQLLKYQEVA